MLTDGLRALLLDACGYDTQVFEFVVAGAHQQEQDDPGGEARRSRAAQRASCWSRCASIKGFYGIREQCLETLLKADALI